jgi:hypothetical protein
MAINMINRKTIFVLLSLSVLLIFLFKLSVDKKSFEERRGEVLAELSSAIDDAVKEGKYKCCIDPPCTMCYLGNWIWEDGTCHCDEMIISGESDKVCPQCVSGLEEGLCKSLTLDECET